MTMSTQTIAFRPCHCHASSFNKTPPKNREIILNPKLRFTKPSPTPLLTTNKTQNHTKLQALEAAISQLETAIKKGIKINDPHVFSTLLESCFQQNAARQCARIHALIPLKLIKNVGISSKLLRLYASSGRVELAHQLFDEMPERNRNSSAFAWNSLMSGYVDMGLYEDALALYFQMLEEGVEPDGHTFPRVLKACGGVGMIHVGEEVHRHVVRCGFGSDGFVLNALVDMYSKCGNIIKARKVFERIVHKDLVSWNSMVVGYVRHGVLVEALRVVREMVSNGHEPDSVAISAILTGRPLYEIGTQVHGWVIRRGIEWNLSIANSLICFYSNQSKLELARWLFEHMPERDVVSWNSVISAHSKDAKTLFYLKEMVNSGTSPDGITFVSALSACAHRGMVEDGERIFTAMKGKFGIRAKMEHYACLVNMYGRAGLIDAAYHVIQNRMEFEAGPTVWGALLYACYLHGNAEIGEVAANNLFDLEPDNEHNFELLMKIYQRSGRSDDLERVRLMMAERGLDV